MEIRVAGKYKLVKKLGNGAFGDVYQAMNQKKSEEVAVKLEKVNAKNQQLQYEYRLYKLLEGHPGVPRAISFDQEGDYNVMVMEALGPSLDSLHEFCLREFSEMTLALVGIQCIRRLEWIHSKGFIHRDIKPENFLIGSKSKEDTIFIIDFGLAKRYLDPKTGQHIAFKKHKGCFGTQRYQSLRATFGHEQSRRDDLEALGYMLAYFANKGSLPWMRKQHEDKSESKSNSDSSKEEAEIDTSHLRLKEIAESKRDTDFSTLFSCCASPEFAFYMDYCRSLPFEAKPDYTFLVDLFERMIRRLISANQKKEFDWMLRRQALIDRTR